MQATQLGYWTSGILNVRALSLPPLFLLLVLGAMGLMGAGAWFAGEGVYRHGVGVMASAHAEPAATGLAYFVDPLQLHVVGAGVAIALSAMAVGLAFRATVIARMPQDPHWIEAALGVNLSEAGVDSVSPIPPNMGPHPPRVPAARFALLTSLVALITIAGGWWVLARSGETSFLAYHDLWMWIRDPTQNNGFWLTRRLAHITCGVCIVVVPVLIAIITRLFPRGRKVLSLLALLLLAAIAGQIWLGVLLLNDSNAGPVTRFNAAENAK